MDIEELKGFPPAYELELDKSFKQMQIEFWEAELLEYLHKSKEYKVDLKKLERSDLFKYEPTAELVEAVIAELVKKETAFEIESTNYLVFVQSPQKIVSSLLEAEPITMLELRRRLEKTLFDGLMDEKVYFDQMLVDGECQGKWRLWKENGDIKGIKRI